MFNKYDKAIGDAYYELSVAKDKDAKTIALAKLTKAKADVDKVLNDFYNTLRDLGLEEGFRVIADRLSSR